MEPDFESANDNDDFNPMEYIAEKQEKETKRVINASKTKA